MVVIGSRGLGIVVLNGDGLVMPGMGGTDFEMVVWISEGRWNGGNAMRVATALEWVCRGPCNGGNGW